MFVMRVAMSAGRLLGRTIHLSSYRTSLMLLGVICVAMVTGVVIL